ncbi:hypothetical protein LNTAR_12511 [Lentisphaera araneosa HTCC2155]|uniref:Uncharacterized protein n=1 Tax=Lentisphaera araneosa HTCC2155 TaxID=313628 RepID=A6DJV3_9BACT|nr:hypothetical protein LNTAR_12511 [Lentisphaera araneosa HTCC2155]
MGKETSDGERSFDVDFGKEASKNGVSLKILEEVLSDL